MGGSPATKEFSPPGETLKRLRTEQSMAQEGLSVRSGVYRGLISAIETHGRNPSLKTKSLLAEALGVKVSDIWPDDHDD